MTEASKTGKPLGLASTAGLGLVERLRQRREFYSTDRMRWYMSANADGDCQEAAAELERMAVQLNGLKFDALGEPRTRYVRVTLDGSHCVMHPSEGDRYVQDAREAGDESQYTVADVWLSEREFDDMPEFDGF